MASRRYKAESRAFRNNNAHQIFLSVHGFDSVPGFMEQSSIQARRLPFLPGILRVSDLNQALFLSDLVVHGTAFETLAAAHSDCFLMRARAR